MARTRGDWYPTTQEGENEMYNAIFTNIDTVDVTLQMDGNRKKRLKDMSQVYMAYYQNLLLNRAAVKSLGTDFNVLMKGRAGTDPMPVAPVYHPLVLIEGDFVGMEAEMREMRRYMTGLFTWTEGMGDVLKMNGKEADPPNLAELAPTLKINRVEDNRVYVSARKEGMQGIEYQYRTAGADVWQPLANSGESETILEIPVPPGTAQKIELRAIFLEKFKRVGNWSPTYNVAVG